MPGNFMRETPREYDQRLERDAQALWHLLYSISGEEPDFESEEDRAFALVAAEDYIDRGDDSITMQAYVEQIYQLQTSQS